MITRLAPWQRINIALVRGILLKPSGNMQWTARITTLTARKQDSQTFNWMGDADSELDAAQAAAEASAKRLYGQSGAVSFISELVDRDAPLYTASIGLYNNGVTKGCSLSMLILRYRHPVTGK